MFELDGKFDHFERNVEGFDELSKKMLNDSTILKEKCRKFK
jgi:hypothetical protein